ncbi:MAG: hypothetical protein ACE14V_01480 [bacterium]
MRIKKYVWLSMLVFLFSYVAVMAQESHSSNKSIYASPLKKIAGKNQWKEYKSNPILIRGKQGQWDDWAIGSMSVVIVNGTFHLYYEGWGWAKPIQIGHATSKDGIHWKKDRVNPVLPVSKEGWDGGGTWDPYVIYEDGKFKMWYGGTPQGDCNGKFHWGYAESIDGSHFVKKGIISNEVSPADFEDDHVIHDVKSGYYYMYYWDRNKEPKGLYRVQSKNETDFDFRTAEPVRIEGVRETYMHKFTQVFQINGKWYMYYAEFRRPRAEGCWTGYATSQDGLNWKVENGQVLLVQDADVTKVADDLYVMYYCPNGFFDSEHCDIRLAVLKGNLDSLKNVR